MEQLDLINAPLEGINLIEASAGTGKTYTIEGLFLRLILEKQFLIDQILVVTFTKAATEELRDRIRVKLLQAEKAFISGTSKDDLLMNLIKRQTDHAAAIDLLHDALVEFDKAPIFTIHGFCARILYEHAFETANLFDTELITEQTQLVREVAEDFWRKNFYNAPLELISYFVRKFNGPRYFWQLLGKLRAADMHIVPKIRKPRLKNIPAFRTAFQRLQAQWPSSRQAVIQALQDPALSGTPYGSLKPAEIGAAMTKRDIKIGSMVDDMDRYVMPMSTGFPLFKNFEKFTTRQLNRSVRRNQSPPSHEFFFTCDEVYRIAAELQAEMENYLVYLKANLFAYASSELRERKAAANTQFYDDLLVLVKKALAAQKENPLAAVIRQRYKAALVDEFQDTDSVQYEIFSQLFSDKDSLLFMIGDPKQAIYSFRGADIFSYLKAAQDAKDKFTLIENWRSDPLLIKAVNTIFSKAKDPFLFKEIPFCQATPGHKRSIASEANRMPLTLWYLDSRAHSDQNKPISKSEAEALIADGVAEEICRMVTMKSKHWLPGDIAVLVRTNRQAQHVKARLSAKGLPSVLYSTGNIFDSHEAMEIEKVLLSIAEPDNMGYLRAALTMDMLGAKGEDFRTWQRDIRLWENRLTRIREYSRAWRRSGFMRMFQMMSSREKIRQRLLSFPDGERRLTNVLQMAEILHQESSQQNLGVAGLLRWLAEQRDPQSPRLEQHQLRLESDKDAVKIVTIHKSKGLEYPVVFCPYGWEGSLLRDNDILFHQPDGNQRLTLDLGSDSRALNRIYAQNELLAENIRLLYVALTRAKSKCYIAWGRINTADSSALAYLLHTSEELQSDSRTVDLVATLKKKMAAKSDEDRIKDLKRLAQESQGCIEIAALPPPSDGNYFETAAPTELLTGRQFTGEIDRTWRISSYSSLISRRISDIDLPDRDAFADLIKHLADDTAADVANAPKPSRPTDIFEFPKGARTGNFFHDLLEHLDFTDRSEQALKSRIQKALQSHGFDSGWQDVIAESISHVLNVSLKPAQPEFVLSSIPCENRINEMEFYFPIHEITPKKLRTIFKQHGSLDRIGEFPNRLQKLVFSPTAGFMKGYIDLVFKNQDQYYLLDWKSNYLGSEIENYQQEALGQTMQENYYVLQYHLYALAFTQYLRLRNPDFQYESDFGGVFYVFLRGVDSRRGPQFGIYYDNPQPALIYALGNALIPGYAKVQSVH